MLILSCMMGMVRNLQKRQTILLMNRMFQKSHTAKLVPRLGTNCIHSPYILILRSFSQYWNGKGERAMSSRIPAPRRELGWSPNQRIENCGAAPNGSPQFKLYVSLISYWSFDTPLILSPSPKNEIAYLGTQAESTSAGKSHPDARLDLGCRCR